MAAILLMSHAVPVQLLCTCPTHLSVEDMELAVPPVKIPVVVLSQDVHLVHL